MVLETGIGAEVAVVPEVNPEQPLVIEADPAGKGVPEHEIYPPATYPEVIGVAIMDLSGSRVACGGVELLLAVDAPGPEP